MTWRIMAALVAVVLIALLVQDVPLASYLREAEEQRITTGLERDAFVLAGRSQDALADVPEDPADDAHIQQLARDYQDASGARVVITDAAGVAIATSDPVAGDDAAAVGDDFSTRPEFVTALGGGIANGERFSETLGGELLFVAVPVLAGDEILGAVRLTYDDATVTAAVNAKLASLAIVGVTTAVLAALIGLVLSRSITRRLRLLRDVTERFAAGERDARADEASGAGELRSVARSFNTMAGRIDGLIGQQRAFAGDASHQLRTPLTALRLRLERARELTASDPDAAVERLEAAERELDRLDTLIEGLLVLSRAEDPAAAERIDLAAAAAERVAAWDALAAERGATVRYAGPDSAAVLAVPSAVEQIVDNLVDNALLAAGDGAEVTVEVREGRDGGLGGAASAELHVLDRGPGLRPEQRERAFDRFWRGRPDGDGSGLGLAIVARLAEASGASAELLARDGGGIDAVVRFRAAGASAQAPATAIASPAGLTESRRRE